MNKFIGFVFIALFFATGTLSAFEVKYRIYPAGTDAVLRFKAVSQWAEKWLESAETFLKEGKNKNIRKGKDFSPVGYFRVDRRYSDREDVRPNTVPEPLDFKIENKEILVKVKLTGENFHYIIFSQLPVPEKGQRNLRCIKLMTLNEDAFKLRPFRGNLHQHSRFSDGKFEPEEHIFYARVAGFDFIGLSDHGRYTQNAGIIKAAADSKSGLTVYPAEELHTPGTILHGLSIGASKTHSHWNRTAKWMKEVNPVMDEIRKKYPTLPDSEILPWAESLIVAKRAKDDGALLVYCHPAWHLRYYLNNSRRMSDFMIRSGAFDVVEVINGSMFGKSGRENAEVLAQFHEICVELGKKIPVMSSSDSHNVSSPAYSRNYNVIFAADCTFPSFKAAFKEGRSVASYNLGEKISYPLNLGPFRFVCYANFLDEIGFWHKQLKYTKQQSILIMKYLKGDKSVIPEIQKLNDKIAEYRESIYYKSEK